MFVFINIFLQGRIKPDKQLNKSTYDLINMRFY